METKGFKELKKACENFVNKVETGRARSKESYAEMKAALDLIENHSSLPNVVNWLPFKYGNHRKYQQYHKEGRLIVRFEDGTECNFADELPQKTITHFRKE